MIKTVIFEKFEVLWQKKSLFFLNGKKNNLLLWKLPVYNQISIFFDKNRYLKIAIV